MDGLDGILLLPPDRSHLLGRAVWKARYVVVGRRAPTKKSRQDSANPHGGRPHVYDAKPPIITDDYCISVFKSKDDSDPIHQWPTGCVSDCQVQMLAYRKQGPVLPTLVVTLSDRERKRRSSRTVGLIASKDSGINTLWFRTPPDDHHPSLHEWAHIILSMRVSAISESSGTPTISSPYSFRNRDTPDYLPRPGSRNNSRSDIRPLQHKSSSATYSTGTRERPATFSSDSPSLRSKRSDVSSPSSINQHHNHKATYTIAGQHYTTVLPTDVVSSDLGEGAYQPELTERWTTAYGQLSTMNSPSSPSAQQPMVLDVNAPPAPGETILDRAFQLGHISGADTSIPGQEKLSSVARFDALMCELEEKRKQKQTAERAEQSGVGSNFDADDSSGETEAQDSEEDSGSDDAHSADEQDHGYGKGPAISPSTQRAIAFITGRHGESSSRRPTVSKTHLSIHTEPSPPPPQSSPLRPRTAHAKGRPNPSQRAKSTPHLAPTPPRKPAEDGVARRANAEKQISGPSTKRLSSTEFTKSLSSTSSLLLVQTNASGESSRGSFEAEPATSQRTHLSYRGTVPSSRRAEGEEQNKKRGWRGSLDTVGSKGRFL